MEKFVRTLSELPDLPSGKTGWPWTEQSDPLLEAHHDETPWPKISIITPSYNQGQFIEPTIRSVLMQEYPNIEYIVMDGGSTDSTVSILERYDDQIDYCESTPDRGQTHAINKGFERATGSIVGWLNSDDFLLPGALQIVVDQFRKNQGADIVSGGGIVYRSEENTYRSERPCIIGIAPTLPMMLAVHGNVIQHSTFWRSQILNSVGMLDESYDYAMDHDFFTRCCAEGKTFSLVNKCLAAFRKHPAQKTNHGNKYVKEAARSHAKHLGRNLTTSPFIVRLHKWLFDLLTHRNRHPRLGLKFTTDRDFDAWIRAIHRT